MPVEVNKQDRETPQSLIRRFTKRVQRSGVLIEARKNRFLVRIKSQEMRKRAALRKVSNKIAKEKEEKMGLVKETKYRR